jgi:hypothetical protein
MISKSIRFLKRQQNNIQELIWANVWHDTIRGIEWASNLPSLSPGRTAVGYNYLYVMTRILNEKKPLNVLDIGLGISSTLISEYFRHVRNAEANHMIIEHDESWINFYCGTHKLSDYSKIVHQERITKEIDGNVFFGYSDLKGALHGKKFSVISVDAPQGGAKHTYARRDIIDFLPDILESSWVILIDDADRKGEKRTISDIEKKLSDKGIEYCSGIYKGATSLCVIASVDNRFLCTM